MSSELEKELQDREENGGHITQILEGVATGYNGRWYYNSV